MPCPQPDDPAPPPTTSTTADPAQVTICVRCKANPAIAIFRDSIYCQDCALAVFYTKAKTGFEYARGAGLAKYVAAARTQSIAETDADSEQVSSSSAAVNGEGSKSAKQINNGGGNAEVNVSANIAIAFSGGASSRALLRTATQYFRPETAFATRDARRRRARGEDVDTPETEASSSSSKPRGTANTAGRFNEVGKIYVLYIDDSAIVPNDDGVDRTEAARKMVEEEGCPDLHFVGLKLEDVFRTSIPGDAFEGVPWKLSDVDDQQLSSTPSSIPDPRQAIKDLFSSLHPPQTPRTGASSARTRIEDLHRILISHLLRRTASSLTCSALLLGDSATRISIRLIEDLAKGAGHKVAVQNNEAAWIDDLLVIRPFKGHLMQEVLFYTSALGLEPLRPKQHVVNPTVTMEEVLGNGNSNTPLMDKSSIARLTETFTLNLEKGVASTVTTIGKTGSKLVLNTTSEEEVQDVARSTSGFQKVGPSVPLRSRNAVTDKMANMTLGKDASVTEPRIGSRGIKLAQTSASCFRWDTRSGCALCGMPSQHPKARHWKRDITISSLGETAPSQRQTDGAAAESGSEGWIELADHLCYACLLVLAPPIVEGGEEQSRSLLPTYVLGHILRSSAQAQGADAIGVNGVDGGEAVEREDEEAMPNGKHGNCASHSRPAPQPLRRSEIKAQIDEFLLEDD